MKLRFQPWQLAVLVVVACVAAIGLAHWWSNHQTRDMAWMLQVLPEDRSVHMFLDVEALRDGGMLDVLAGPAPPEDPDYSRFVQDTRFDYRTDLNAVAAAFTRGQVYMALRGEFRWPQLSAYALAQGGSCLNSVCEMPGSRAGRNISFYPVKSDVLALAVSSRSREVTALEPHEWRNPPRPVATPLWISAPGPILAELASMPAGSNSFLSPLREAQRATFTVGTSTEVAFTGFSLEMDALFRSPAMAGDVARQLTATTDLLRSMLTRENLKASPADLSGVLTSGRFHAEGDRLAGVWSVDRRFVDTLLSGKLQ